MTATKRAPARGLKFSPSNHRYTLDGKWVPGVTTILGVLNKEAIPKWAAEQVATFVATQPDAVESLRPLGERGMVAALKEVPWKKRDDAGARGHQLHDHAEHLLRGEEIELDDDDELIPVIEHALQFLEDWAIDPILIEAAVGSREHWWAGTLDLVATYVNPHTGASGTAIWDWKSGKKIYPETVWQLNAYGHAEFTGLSGDERQLPPIDAAFGVHIRADGVDVYPCKWGPDIYDEFVAIRHVYGIAKTGRGDWKTPGSGHLGIALSKGETAA